MTKRGTEMFAFVAIFLVFHCGVGSAFFIHMRPDKIDPITSEVVTISCRLGKNDTKVKEVVKIEIVNGADETVASLQNSKVTTGTEIKTPATAEGKIFTIPSDSYLKLILLRPGVEDAGSYTCVLHFLDDTGDESVYSAYADLLMQNENSALKEHVLYLTKQMSSLLKERDVEKTALEGQQQRTRKEIEDLKNKIDALTVTNEELNSGLQKQENELQSLKNVIDQLQSELKDQADKDNKTAQSVHKLEKDTNDQIMQLEKGNQDAQKDMKKLTDSLKTQTTNLQDLMTKDSFASGFNAGYGGSIDYNHGKIILFNKQVTQIGSAYNKNTGVYTAPTDGIYIFHVAALSKEEDKTIEALIQVNGEDLACTYGASEDTLGFGSTSAVVKLKHGDRVWAKERYATVSYNLDTFPFSVFSGVLVKAL